MDIRTPYALIIALHAIQDLSASISSFSREGFPVSLPLGSWLWLMSHLLHTARLISPHRLHPSWPHLNCARSDSCEARCPSSKNPSLCPAYLPHICQTERLGMQLRPYYSGILGKKSLAVVMPDASGYGEAPLQHKAYCLLPRRFPHCLP